MAETSSGREAHLDRAGKGGARYPRYTLQDCLEWTAKLVTETSAAPQPKDVIWSKVVGAGRVPGEMRVSSLKQYGFISRVSFSYTASPLAKRVSAAAEADVLPLCRKAMLTPPVFHQIYSSFLGESVSRTKLRDRACDLEVHPDEADYCTAIYISGLMTSGLGVPDGDKVLHATLPPGPRPGHTKEARPGMVVDGNILDAIEKARQEHHDDDPAGHAQGHYRAVFNVNVTLDATMDTEKLSQQLELLKKFGAI